MAIAGGRGIPVTDNQTLGTGGGGDARASAAARRLAWLEETVLVDPLTGLGNRRAAAQAFEAALASSQRHDIPVAVALVDIDGLKAINDEHGHAAGDAALVAFADALRQSMRADDTAFRFGGDEFVVLSPGASAAELVRLFDRVRLTAPAFTVGVAQAPADGISESALVAVADQRMYAARRSSATVPTAVPMAPRRRRLVTVGAVLALLSLGFPVFAWARQADVPDDRASGTTSTTARATSTTSTSTTSTSVGTIVGGPIVTPVTVLIASRPIVAPRPVAARSTPVSSTATTTAGATVEPGYEATAVDERGKGRAAGKKPPKGHGRGKP